jgi:hypothetical protein
VETAVLPAATAAELEAAYSAAVVTAVALQLLQQNQQ